MKIREFFQRFEIMGKDFHFVEKAIADIEEEPGGFTYGAIRAWVDGGEISKDFLLGILIGFAASDERTQFKKESTDAN